MVDRCTASVRRKLDNSLISSSTATHRTAASGAEQHGIVGVYGARLQDPARPLRGREGDDRASEVHSLRLCAYASSSAARTRKNVQRL